MEFQAYPKWLTLPDGGRVIVPDAATEAHVLAQHARGAFVPPVVPVSAQGEHLPHVPSVRTVKGK